MSNENFDKIENYYVYDISKIDKIDFNHLDINIEKMLYVKKISDKIYSESGLYPITYGEEGILCIKFEGFKAKRFIDTKSGQATLSLVATEQILEIANPLMIYLEELTTKKLIIPLKKNLFNRGNTRKNTHFIQIKVYQDKKGLKNIKDEEGENMSNLPYERFIGDFVVSITGIFVDINKSDKDKSVCSIVCHLVECFVLKEINNDILLKIKKNRRKNITIDKIEKTEIIETPKNPEVNQLKSEINDLKDMFKSFMLSQSKINIQTNNETNNKEQNNEQNETNN